MYDVSLSALHNVPLFSQALTHYQPEREREMRRMELLTLPTAVSNTRVGSGCARSGSLICMAGKLYLTSQSCTHVFKGVELVVLRVKMSACLVLHGARWPSVKIVSVRFIPGGLGLPGTLKSTKGAMHVEGWKVALTIQVWSFACG